MMNSKVLLDYYHRIADAPDAVEQLRRFVLDLAVRGKLVPQDPNDEPASVLLEQITHERKLQQKKNHTTGEELVLSEDEIPFYIPSSWVWAKLGNIFNYDAGIKRNPNELDPEKWLLELEDIEKNSSRLLKRVKVKERSSLSTKSEFQINDILYGKLRPYLNKVLVADEPGYSTTEIVVLRPYVPLCAQYCVLALQRPDFVDYVTRLGQGTKMPRLRTDDALNAPFPLPPLAEQQRIVERVDQLMAFCDQLEAAREQREQSRSRFSAATLARLNQPADDATEFRADAAFALQHIDLLSATPAQIKALRQTILNLAVRGKLVPQDPNDEPASVLLERIAEEKAEKGILKQTKYVVQNITNETIPFQLPTNWSWINFSEIIIHSESGWSPKTENFPRQGESWGVLKVSAVSWDKFRPWENKEVLPNTKPRLQAQVRKGDFLISRANTAELIARAVIVDEEPYKLMMSDKIVRLILSEHCEHNFICMLNNNADFAREHYVTHASGVSPSMKNISRDVIMNLPIPLPPLAEQQRIIAKVDQLMALCDQLEQQVQAGAAIQARLLEAVLHEALAEPDHHTLNLTALTA